MLHFIFKIEFLFIILVSHLFLHFEFLRFELVIQQQYSHFGRSANQLYPSATHLDLIISMSALPHFLNLTVFMFLLN